MNKPHYPLGSSNPTRLPVHTSAFRSPCLSWPILGCAWAPGDTPGWRPGVSQWHQEPPPCPSGDPDSSLPSPGQLPKLPTAGHAEPQPRILGHFRRTALLPLLSLSIWCTQIFVTSDCYILSAEVPGDQGQVGDPWGAAAEGLVLIC